MNRKLYRSRTEKMLGGVCGGLASYAAIDPVIVRLFFVIFTLAGGAGVLIYLILWIVIPEEGKTAEEWSDQSASSRIGAVRDDFIEAARKPNPQAVRYLGAAVIAAGVLLLLQNLDISWLWWLKGDLIWPLVLVAGGVLLLMRAFRKDE